MVPAGAPRYVWDCFVPWVTGDQVFYPDINSSCLSTTAEHELEYRFFKCFLLFIWCFDQGQELKKTNHLAKTEKNNALEPHCCLQYVLKQYVDRKPYLKL